MEERERGKESITKEKNRILKHIARILAEENQITRQEQFRMLDLLRKG